MSRYKSSSAIRQSTHLRDTLRGPRNFRVVMHNDDYTTMEFVVEVLQTVFHHPPPNANRIMLEIHVKGSGSCGIFPFEIAETKIDQVQRRAQEAGFPLKCSLEEV